MSAATSLMWEPALHYIKKKKGNETHGMDDIISGPVILL